MADDKKKPNSKKSKGSSPGTDETAEADHAHDAALDVDAGAAPAERPQTAMVAGSTPEGETVAPVADVGVLNLLTIGELVLAYPERDVTLTLDGASAARVLAAFARPERRRFLQDQLSTTESPMRNLWATFDLDSLLAVSWYPQLPTKATSRMTIDPPNPRAIAEVVAESDATASTPTRAG